MAGVGVNTADKKLAAEVRRLTLNKIKSIFEQPRVDMTPHDAELHDALLTRLAGTVLPRLTEVTGEDGGAVELTVIKYAMNAGNDSTPIRTEAVPDGATGGV
jgi:hypothetical protein